MYNGYGHAHNLHVYGHILSKLPPERDHHNDGILYNIFHLLQLFFPEPIPRKPVQLETENKVLSTKTEDDGFFNFEWSEDREIAAGWHTVYATAMESNCRTEGKVYIPHSTQLAFISDIDDTILVSHSATTFKKLQQLFMKSPVKRMIFDDVVEHYQLLAKAHTTDEMPNPFFYVSSSEWNLYDYLTEIFSTHHLPEGVFLLNEIKRWFELLKTGKTKHEGKLMRIVRIFDAFPKQRFVLMGDNSQKDPFIYQKLAERYTQKIHAVYIRRVVEKKAAPAEAALSQIKSLGIDTCLFKTSREAIEHSRKTGLIE